MIQADLKLVLLAGQSNMAGRGWALPEDLVSLPRVRAWGKDGQWHEAIEPITQDRAFVGSYGADGEKITSVDPWDSLVKNQADKVLGVGPGRTFGRLLSEAWPQAHIGLIPTAVGGTPLASWMPGGKDSFDPDLHPYDDAIAAARQAQQFGQIVAVLWHQGETDALQKNAHYEADLAQVITNFRRDLHLDDTIPFILGELGSFYAPEIQNQVPFINQAMHNLAQNLPQVGVVATDDLSHRGDKLHFDAASQHRLGARYFAKFQEMTEQ